MCRPMILKTLNVPAIFSFLKKPNPSQILRWKFQLNFSMKFSEIGEISNFWKNFKNSQIGCSGRFGNSILSFSICYIQRQLVNLVQESWNHKSRMHRTSWKNLSTALPEKWPIIRDFSKKPLFSHSLEKVKFAFLQIIGVEKTQNRPNVWVFVTKHLVCNIKPDIANNFRESI